MLDVDLYEVTVIRKLPCGDCKSSNLLSSVWKWDVEDLNLDFISIDSRSKENSKCAFGRS